MDQRARRCRIAGYGPEQTEGTIVLEPLGAGRRLRRALAGFGICLALAVASAFVPVAHFVLVPGLLVAAFVVFAVRFGVTTLVVSARGTCPDCGAEQDLDLLGPWKGLREVVCRSCHRSLRLLAAGVPEAR